MIDIAMFFLLSKEDISYNLIQVSLWSTNDDSQKFPFDNSPAKSNMKKIAYLFEDRNASRSLCKWEFIHTTKDIYLWLLQTVQLSPIRDARNKNIKKFRN